MRICKHIAPIFVQPAFEHEKIKAQVLEVINSNKIFNCVGLDEDIANTDYYIAPHFKLGAAQKYWDLVFPSVEKHYNDLIKITAQKNWSIGSFWFQKYNPNGFHGWHVHSSCMFSNVYYLDLPQGAAKTTFWYLDEEFEIDVQEGDIITFPSFLPHCSKPNKAATPKHVISFNSNMNM